MKSFDVSKDSWHYKLAKSGGLSFWYGDTDICSYTKNVFWGLLFFIFKSIVVLIVYSMFCFFTGAFMYALISSLMFGVLNFSEPAVIGATGCFVALFAYMVPVLLEKKHQRDNNRDHFSSPKKEPGFVSVAYSAFKDKYCFRVEIKE